MLSAPSPVVRSVDRLKVTKACGPRRQIGGPNAMNGVPPSDAPPTRFHVLDGGSRRPSSDRARPPLAFGDEGDRSRPVPRSLTHLTSSIARVRGAKAEEKFSALDHAAARLVEAGHACGVLPSVLLPAQRTLMLLGGRPRRGATPTDPDGLLAALDAVMDPQAQSGGFSRLLQSAIDAGEFAAAEEVRLSDVSDDERPAFQAVLELKRHYVAIDDLTHALDVRPDFPAAFTLAKTLVAFAFDDLPANEQRQWLADWLAHRGVNPQLLAVVEARGTADDLDATVLEKAKPLGVGQARALSLWVLSDQLASRMRPAEKNIGHWHTLLDQGRLAALEVFDAADLWLQLDDGQDFGNDPA